MTRRVMLESPFAGKGSTDEAREADRKDNILYARACARDCYLRGEMPMASHLYFTQFMDDHDPKERQDGIDFGYEWWPDCETVVFYVDKGMSSGMVKALERTFKEGKPVEFRRLTNKNELPGTKDSIVVNEALEQLQAAAASVKTPLPPIEMPHPDVMPDTPASDR